MFNKEITKINIKININTNFRDKFQDQYDIKIIFKNGIIYYFSERLSNL